MFFTDPCDGLIYVSQVGHLEDCLVLVLCVVLSRYMILLREDRASVFLVDSFC